MKKAQKIGLSLLSGLLLSLSWPEIGNMSLLIFTAFIPLFYLFSFSPPQQWRSSFIFAFFSFLIWHIITDYWMLYSTIIGSITAWIINSFMMASVISLAFYSKNKIKWIPFEIILSFYWLSFEILHLFWDLSWPWMSLGHAFAKDVEWIQWYEYIGIYGGAFWIIVINGLLYRLISAIKKNQLRSFIWSTSLSVLFLMLPILFSLYLFKRELPIQSEIKISVVQTNFDTYTEKFSGLSPLEQSDQILDMLHDIQEPIDLCVLPETAIPENIEEHTTSYPLSIKNLLHWSEVKSYPTLGSYYSKDSLNSYNTAALFQNGEINQVRHKSKLVPFAESMPFEFITKGLRSIIKEEGGTGSTFSRDEYARVFSMNNSKLNKLGTLICFESIFPDIIAEMVRNGAEFLIIITNDDWWFDTPGHRQHFTFARVHAIENRRPIARAANTGISGFIDAKGVVLQASTYREKTQLTETLSSPSYETFFSKNERNMRWMIISIRSLIILLQILLYVFSKGKKAVK
ncbi:MAG: apolipoprotein N-acyltransferase [Bacteroidales bacterium]|nr:apolipoprotein N-acyltransferase [Bacteroidales bacterium]